MPENRLTREQVIQISGSRLSGVVLAGIFNVSAVTIHYIRTGKRWSNVTGRDNPDPKNLTRKQLDCYEPRNG